MRMGENSDFGSNGLFTLKNQDWLEKQRVAGRIAAGTLNLLEDLVKGKTFHSLKALNDVAEEHIIKSGGIPTFKGYKGFPAGVCISVNRELVHGIPKDYVLDEGDVVSFDLGVTIDGAIADTAITCIFGQPKSDLHVRLIKATEEALMKGIKSIQVGKRLGCIGNTIYRHGKGEGFGVITQYGGHGLDWDKPHASPFVPNRSEMDEGIRIQPNMTIAIEPMFTIGPPTTRVEKDGWTVMTHDIGAHAEHTVFIHEDHVEIITDRSAL